MPGAPRLGFLPFETFDDDAPVYLDAAPLVIADGYQFYPSVFSPPPSPATLVHEVEKAGHILQVLDDVRAGRSLLFSENPAVHTNHPSPSPVDHAHAQGAGVLPTPESSPAPSARSLDDSDDESSSSDESIIGTPPSSPGGSHEVAIAPAEEPKYTDEPKCTLGKRRRDTSEEAEAPPPRRQRSEPPSSPRQAPRPRPLGATRSLNDNEDLESLRSVGPAQGSTCRTL